jgi:diguanylate cyclase (GGDEF)-like protein
MNKIFSDNLNSLRQANNVVAIFAASISLYPLLLEKDFIKAGFCFLTAFIAFLFSLYMNYKIQTSVTVVSNRFLYIFTSLFFANIMLFGLYLGVFSTPDKLATLFLCFLICALLFFINPPIFNLCLTVCAIVIFSVSTILIKTENYYWAHDIVGVIVAGTIGLYFNWQNTKLRLGLELSTAMLEEERNKYLDQSTIDELTQINNRRDFMQTFKRYLSSYRTNDDWLCVAISDIDFFKNYNDNYGHPQGDECLRSVGAVFRKLNESMGVYVARVGGEEFAMLWFEKDASHVDVVVKKAAELIREMNVLHEFSKVSEYITMSMGVYIERCGASNDVQTLYDLADKALYAAKGSGRNRTVITGREIEQYSVTPES